MDIHVHEAADIMLQTAREYGSGNALPGDVIAATYRLATAKLRQHGSELHANDLERAATQAEKISQ